MSLTAAKCSAALKEIQRTREPMLITLRGKPLATVQPVETIGQAKRLGGLKGRMAIRRDLVKVVTQPETGTCCGEDLARHLRRRR